MCLYAVAVQLGATDQHDGVIWPWHRRDAAAPRQRLCRAGQWRHLAASHLAEGEGRGSRKGPSGFFGCNERAHAAVVAHDRGSRYRKRSEEHTSELQSLMRISYAVFCLEKKN